MITHYTLMLIIPRIDMPGYVNPLDKYGYPVDNIGNSRKAHILCKYVLSREQALSRAERWNEINMLTRDPNYYVVVPSTDYCA